MPALCENLYAIGGAVRGAGDKDALRHPLVRVRFHGRCGENSSPGAELKPFSL